MTGTGATLADSFYQNVLVTIDIRPERGKHLEAGLFAPQLTITLIPGKKSSAVGDSSSD